jgi:hypothetical protein
MSTRKLAPANASFDINLGSTPRQPTFDPFLNSIPNQLPHPHINPSSSANPPASHSLRIKRRRIAEYDRALEAVRHAVFLLENEFKLREAASQAFPPEISFSHIRTSVGKYEDEMSAVPKKSVCSCCGKFIATVDIYQIDDANDFILPLQGSLDYCGRHESTWNFCASCNAALSRGNIPKLSAKNLINVTMCQHYPPALEDLTAIEECLIAKCHPVGTILKLRPGSHSSSAAYNALRGHIIVIPQDPGPLLQILPSPELRLDNLVKVFWLGKRAPVESDLKPFLQVRKDKVLTALQYLVQYNHLYRDITINYGMTDNWDDDFIPSEIQDNIIYLGKSDHHEREGYTVSLQAGNYENDLHAAQDEVSHLDDDDHGPLITGSVYTDINGERQDPNVRTIDALRAVVASNPCRSGERQPGTDDAADEHEHRQRNMPTISYAIRGRSTLMNHWEDPHFFTAAFPTLFPSGIGGHQDQRTVPVSLRVFAEWALNHHSRRYEALIHCYENLIIVESLQICTSSNLHVPSLRCFTAPEFFPWKYITCETSKLEGG